MRNKIVLKANAKINLTLNILGKENGLHKLESIATSIDLADKVIIKKNNSPDVNIKMSGLRLINLSALDNNAYKAAIMFIKTFKTSGVDIYIKKKIPVGAGLGGSAANAAAVICGMKKLFNINDEKAFDDLAKSISSDTLFMTKGGFGKICGTGDIVTPIKSNIKLYFLAVTAGGGISTKQCFETFNKLPKPFKIDTDLAENHLKQGSFTKFSIFLNNMLYPAATALNGEIDKAKTHLELLGAPVNMSGSGSTMYALFDSLQGAKAALKKYKGKTKARIYTSCNGLKIT